MFVEHFLKPLSRACAFAVAAAHRVELIRQVRAPSRCYHPADVSTPTAHTPPVPALAKRNLSLPVLVATAFTLIVLAYRQLAFAQKYAVDVLYWDSWDLYQTLFDGKGWWASFDQQHGPHRQGIGGMLIRAMAVRSHWDCRWDSFAVAAAIILAATLGVPLAYRLGVRGWALVGVPVIFLNLRQYQMLVTLANPSHGAIPVLLLVLFGLSQFVSPISLRLVLIVSITFVSVFTGFGIFLGAITPIVLGVELGRSMRDRRKTLLLSVALLAIAATWAAFAVGYSKSIATPTPLRWPAGGIGDYQRFVGLLLANAVGLTTETLGLPNWAEWIIGLVIAAGGVAVCAVRGVAMFERGDARPAVNVTIFSLSAFGILFTMNAAVGRTPLGWATAESPRYVTLCIPTLLAIFLHMATSRSRSFRRLAMAGVVALAAGTLVLHPSDFAIANWAHDGVLRWRAAYVVTHDIDAANEVSQFSIYPDATISAHARSLESNHLNLFDPAVFGPVPDVKVPKTVHR